MVDSVRASVVTNRFIHGQGRFVPDLLRRTGEFGHIILGFISRCVRFIGGYGTAPLQLGPCLIKSYGESPGKRIRAGLLLASL